MGLNRTAGERHDQNEKSSVSAILSAGLGQQSARLGPKASRLESSVWILSHYGDSITTNVSVFQCSSMGSMGRVGPLVLLEASLRACQALLGLFFGALLGPCGHPRPNSMQRVGPLGFLEVPSGFS